MWSPSLRDEAFLAQIDELATCTGRAAGWCAGRIRSTADLGIPSHRRSDRVMNVLGIETSCDETSAAVVRDGREVRSNVVSSQIALHQASWRRGARAGGARPADGHHPGGRGSAGEADMELDEIDAIAVTRGPGLGRLVAGRRQLRQDAGLCALHPAGRRQPSRSASLRQLVGAARRRAGRPTGISDAGVARFRRAHRADADDRSWPLHPSRPHAGRCRRRSVRQRRPPAGSWLSGWPGHSDCRGYRGQADAFRACHVPGLARATTSVFPDSKRHCCARSSHIACPTSTTEPDDDVPFRKHRPPGFAAMGCRFPIWRPHSRKRSSMCSRSRPRRGSPLETPAGAARRRSGRQSGLARAVGERDRCPFGGYASGASAGLLH